MITPKQQALNKQEAVRRILKARRITLKLIEKEAAKSNFKRSTLINVLGLNYETLFKQQEEELKLKEQKKAAKIEAKKQEKADKKAEKLKLKKQKKDEKIKI